MARIHRLPVVLQGEAGHRLTGDLTARLEAGEVTGPRRDQIEVLRQSIRESLRWLPGALATASERLSADDPSRRAAEEAVRRFMAEVETLVVMVEARAPSDRPPRIVAGTR